MKKYPSLFAVKSSRAPGVGLASSRSTTWIDALATRLPNAFSTTWPASRTSASGGAAGSRPGFVSLAPVKGDPGPSGASGFGPGVLAADQRQADGRQR